MLLQKADLLEDAAWAEFGHTDEETTKGTWTLCIHGAKVLGSNFAKDFLAETFVVELETHDG